MALYNHKEESEMEGRRALVDLLAGPTARDLRNAPQQTMQEQRANASKRDEYWPHWSSVGVETFGPFGVSSEVIPSGHLGSLPDVSHSGPSVFAPR